VCTILVLSRAWKEWQPSLPVKENGSYVVRNVDTYSMADFLPVSLYSKTYFYGHSSFPLLHIVIILNFHFRFVMVLRI